MKKVIRVKKSHIMEGDRRSTCGCAIGLALQDAGFSEDEIFVSLRKIQIGDAVYVCPPELARFQAQGLKEAKTDECGPRKQRPVVLRLEDLKLKGYAR